MAKRPSGKSKRTRAKGSARVRGARRSPAPAAAQADVSYSVPGGILTPDHAEEQFSPEFDNIVPSRGYGLTPITDVTARRNAERRLERAHEDLEQRVSESTRELSAANLRMLMEVSERIRLEEARAKLLLDFASAQEDERTRVARDLHDSLGQHLAALTMGLKAIEVSEDCPPAVRARVREMQETAERLDEEIDRLSHALRPLALSDLGLDAALRQHLEAWTRESGIPVDVQMTTLGNERFSFIVETTVYRVVQEAMTNVRKHAEATHVSVLAERRAKDLRVIIEDGGKGFDPGQVASLEDGKRLGLRGMRERAVLVGGDLQIESAPGKGTTVYLTIPLDSGDRPFSSDML